MAEVIYAKDKEKIGYENGRGYDSSNTGWTTLELDGNLWKYGSISYTNAVNVNNRKHRFVILWRTERDSSNPGKTTLFWRLYAKIDGDGTVSDQVNVNINLYLDYTNDRVCTKNESVVFNQAFTEDNCVAKGFKEYYHNDEGEGYFTWYADLEIGRYDASRGRRIYFINDRPRTACQWPASARIWVASKVVKGAENINFRWDPATEGYENPVGGY
jgi:hypothetical protein